MKAPFVLVVLLLLVTPLVSAHGAREGGAPTVHSWAGIGAPTNAAEYQITLRCGGLEELEGQGVGCPLRIPDAEDILGQPRLVIHPGFVNITAFNALHGGRGATLPTDDEPPSGQSRDNIVHQPHTTFRSSDPFSTRPDKTLEWKDQPYYSPLSNPVPQNDPSPLCPPLCANQAAQGPDVWGEDNDLAIDAEGRMFEASLYSLRQDAGADLTYALVVWKQHGPHKDRDQDAYYAVLRPSGEKNVIDSVHLAVLEPQQLVATLWRETSATSATPSTWIDVAWSPLERGGTWDRLAADERIGPCQETSNAISDGADLYVVCAAGEGVPNVTPGTLQLWRIQLPHGTTELVADLPLEGEQPVLAVRRDGAMVAAATRLSSAREVHLEVSHGWNGHSWTGPIDYGADFAPGQDLAEVRINALAYHEKTGNLFAVLWQRDAAEANAADPQAAPIFHKRLASIRAGDVLLDELDLGIGDPGERTPFAATAQGVGQSIFEDLHDDLFLWYDEETGVERIFVAYADYGEVLYAEIVEQNSVLLPFFGSPPPPPPVQPVIDPASAAQAAEVLVAAAGGVLATAMVTALLLSRRRTTAKAPTQDP